MSKRVLVASPRSFCAGVVRAIDIVEELLKRHGPPVYVRHEIVHNVHVVRDLEERGAVFVESEEDVPEGALVVLSAHGVAPQGLREVRRARAPGRRRGLPARLQGARRGAPLRGARQDRARGARRPRRGRGHDGEARNRSCSSRPRGRRGIELEEGQRLAYLTQTTLSLDDTADVVDALRERVPISSGHPRRTSATRPRIARTPSSTSARRRSSSSSARKRARTRTASSRSPTARGLMPT